MELKIIIKFRKDIFLCKYFLLRSLSLHTISIRLRANTAVNLIFFILYICEHIFKRLSREKALLQFFH